VNLNRKEMVGQSAALRAMIAIIEKVAPYDANVVIEGETGVGKELAANLIHELRPAAKQPLSPSTAALFLRPVGK